MVEVVVEPVDEGKQHVLVSNRGAQVTEGVGKTLETTEERGDGQITLDEIVELSFGEDGALEAIVKEEGGDGGRDMHGRVGGRSESIQCHRASWQHQRSRRHGW